MAKNKVSDEVRLQRATRMRRMNYERLRKLGQDAAAAEYAAKNGLEVTPAVVAPAPVPSVDAARHADFKAQIDADTAADLDEISPPLPEQKVATIPAPAPVAVTVSVPRVDSPPPAKPEPRPWPDKTTGEIINQCPNPALVILRIADGRLTTMFNYGQRPWKIGARVKVKINQRRGVDAIYETDWSP